MSKPAATAKEKPLTPTKTARCLRLFLCLVCSVAAVFGWSTAHRSSAASSLPGEAHVLKTEKGCPSPLLPPLVRPTSPPPTPLSPRQIIEHNRRIHNVREREPEAAPPTPERMPSGREIKAKVMAARERGVT